MAINLEDFIADFLFELEENITIIENGVISLKNDAGNESEFVKIVRALHTIKGTSRMMKFTTLEKIAHGMESIYKDLQERQYAVSKSFIRLTFNATNHLRETVRHIKATKNDNLPADELLSALEKALDNPDFFTEPVQKQIAYSGTTGPGIADAGLTASIQTETGITPAKQETEKTEYHTIRIRIQTINSLIKALNDLIIDQFQLKKEKDAIGKIEEMFYQLAAFTSPLQTLNPQFRKIKENALKSIQNLNKDFSEKMERIETGTHVLQEEIFSLRMLPLEMILGSLRKMAEETSLGLGKLVNLQITGTDVMLDKMILEKIGDPLIHLLRNAIDHGIEIPELREQKGKARTGQISIICYAESGNIILKIADDGAGLDYDLIRSKALQFAPERENEIRKMSPEDLNTFLFMPGFTTKQNITALSGRGVGLDIVGHNIEKIKGKVLVKSERDKGVAFTLCLPLSLATVEGFFVKAAGEVFLIPANFTRELLIIRQEEIFDLLDKHVIKIRDKIIPVYHLAVVAGGGLSRKTGKLFVLIVETLGETAALIVDSVLQYTSLIYKPLPRNLLKLKALQGIVFDENFSIINVLYIPDVIAKFKLMQKGAATALPGSGGGVQQNFKNILIVDDSLSTREIEKSILEMEDYRVTTARDGSEGLLKLEQAHFHLVITDINMPVMDGSVFLEKLKQDKRYQGTPVIVISTAQDAAVKEKFIKAGAAAFIVKSQFDRNNLVAAVKTLIGSSR